MATDRPSLGPGPDALDAQVGVGRVKSTGAVWVELGSSRWWFPHIDGAQAALFHIAGKLDVLRVEAVDQ